MIRPDLTASLAHTAFAFLAVILLVSSAFDGNTKANAETCCQSDSGGHGACRLEAGAPSMSRLEAGGLNELRIARPASNFAEEDRAVDSVQYACCRVQGKVDWRNEIKFADRGHFTPEDVSGIARWRRLYTKPVICPIYLCHGTCAKSGDSCPSFADAIVSTEFLDP